MLSQLYMWFTFKLTVVSLKHNLLFYSTFNCVDSNDSQNNEEHFIVSFLMRLSKKINKWSNLIFLVILSTWYSITSPDLTFLKCWILYVTEAVISIKMTSHVVWPKAGFDSCSLFRQDNWIVKSLRHDDCWFYCSNLIVVILFPKGKHCVGFYQAFSTNSDPEAVIV